MRKKQMEELVQDWGCDGIIIPVVEHYTRGSRV